MARRGSLAHLKEVARKKPLVRELLEVYLELTEEEIDAYKVAPWIRRLLIKIHEKVAKGESDNIVDMQEYVELMMDATRVQPVQLPLGIVTIPIEIGKMTLELESGAPILMIEPRLIKTPYGAIQLRQDDLSKIINSTVFNRKIYPGEFPDIVQEYMNSKHEVTDDIPLDMKYSIENIMNGVIRQ